MDTHIEQRDQLIESAVSKALEALQQKHPLVTDTFGRHILERLAHEVREATSDMLLLSLLDVTAMAQRLGVSERRVRALAAMRKVGWKIGRGAWVFRPEDVEALRPGPAGWKPGRARK